MNSPSSSALPAILFWNELPQDAVPIRDPDLGTKEVFHRKSGEDFSNGNNPKFTAGATRQVFPLRQPAIQWCQPAIQWWQLELRLQRDSSFQSPPAAESWELELSQERQSQFFARTPREARH